MRWNFIGWIKWFIIAVCFIRQALTVDPVFAVAVLWYYSGFGWFLSEKHRGFPALQYVAEDLVFLYSFLPLCKIDYLL